MPHRKVVLLILATLLIVSACTNKAKQNSESTQPTNTAQPGSSQAATTPAPQADQTQQPAAPQQTATADQPPPPRVVEHNTPPQGGVEPPAKSSAETVAAEKPVVHPPVVIPAGTEITVRLTQTVDAAKNKAGDSFDGTVVQPVVSRGKTLIPGSSPVSGTVVEATRAGKLKGEGRLSVRLTQMTIHGVSYPISTATISHAISGKGKRSAVMIGGGTGAGALIGGLAGGGKGAAIGAVVGGGAGTAGATLTGNEQIAFPAESALTFRLQNPVTLKEPSAATGDTAQQPPQ